jgi:hypothetical protein
MAGKQHKVNESPLYRTAPTRPLTAAREATQLHDIQDLLSPDFAAERRSRRFPDRIPAGLSLLPENNRYASG